MLKEMLFNQAMLGNSGSNIEVVPFTVRKNGTYRTPSNIAYSPVTVEVPQETYEVDVLNATENKTYYSPVGHVYDTVIVNVPRYTLIASGEYEVNCSSTTEVDVTTFTIDTQFSNQILYVKVRKKGFIAQNHYAGSDTWLTFPAASMAYIDNGGYVSYARGAAGGNYKRGITAGTPYGIYPSYADRNQIDIKARYDQDVSLTIDGTFSIEAYLIPYPNNDYPYKERN